jgi:wyosine [tRNA(Phe)-imidazoG37] synthetase (radical SAM superfamily)
MMTMTSITGSGRVLARRARNTLVRSGWIAAQPTTLNVFTTDRCNFSCFYCSRNLDDDASGVENRYHDKSEFHLADLELLLERYPTINHVSFVGIGEPFLIKDLIPMARLAKSQQKYVSVISNGSLLHRHWGDVAPLFDSLSISLHGLTADELKQIAKVKQPVFNQLIENVRYLMEHERQLNPSMEVRASVVYLKQNVQRVAEAASFCQRHLIPQLDVQNYLPYGLDDSANCLFDDEAANLEELSRIAEQFQGKVKINLPILVKRRDEDLEWGCMSFFNTLRVDGLGHVSGCSRVMLPLEENGDFRLDRDVWQNDYFADFRERFHTGKNLPECCRYCPEAQ